MQVVPGCLWPPLHRSGQLGCAADDAVHDDQLVQRFDSIGCDLVVGIAVRATILSHENWGVTAEVLGHETVGASVDAGFIDSPSGLPRALSAEYPPVGDQVDVVVQEISRYHPPAWIRLTMRATDLREFSQPCACCGQLTILSPGGDRLAVRYQATVLIAAIDDWL